MCTGLGWRETAWRQAGRRSDRSSGESGQPNPAISVSNGPPRRFPKFVLLGHDSRGIDRARRHALRRVSSWVGRGRLPGLKHRPGEHEDAEADDVGRIGFELIGHGGLLLAFLKLAKAPAARRTRHLPCHGETSPGSILQRADSSISVHTRRDAVGQNFWKLFVRTGSGLLSRDPTGGYYSSRSGSPVRICEA